MLRSMTGFGRYGEEVAGYAQQWEIKSVNGKHLEIKWKLPSILRHLEPYFDKIARKSASRGKMEISLVIQFSADTMPCAQFDHIQANALLRTLTDFAASRGEKFVPDYGRLLDLPGLWSEPRADFDNKFILQLQAGLKKALADWNKSRETEGCALGADLQSRVIKLQEWTDLITRYAPEIKNEKLESLKLRLQEALEGFALDEQRFLQEAVILADKIDTTEELTRLMAHLDRLHELLSDGKDAGRRLDFTLQECFREINTCGNKLLDTRISRIVGDYKNELEKCREQVMNLE